MAIVIHRPKGDVDLRRFIRGPELLGMKIGARLRFFQAEWFLDQRLGVPYRRRIFRKGVSAQEARFVLRQVVAETPGVRSVDRFSVEPGARARELVGTYAVTAEDGTTVEGTTEQTV